MFGIHLDAAFAVQILIFAAVFTACQAAYGLVRVGGAKRAVNRRLALSESGLAIGDLVGELRKQRGLRQNGEHKLGWPWLADLVVRSGIVYQPRNWAIIIASVSAIAAMAVFMLSRNPLFALGAAVVGAIVPPFGYLTFMAARRARALSHQLPDALEVIVRSLEAGHPVPTAIALVGREMLDPIGSEFGMAADEIAYGATLETAIGHMAARCRHIDIDLFAATIRLQDRSGGNLTGLLRMNAHTVRERRKLRLKIAAASAEGKMSAYILTSAPFCVLGVLELIQPHFYGDVIHEKATQYGLAGLGVWMFLGNLVMRKMINMKI
ncbi:MAG TPA: type II secretion system F family protein [Caulobacteraceae bacterium]|jgi:tight adherence protein B|nr:type II secretion system F family protein [Caulobacteraceae bacterium]